VSWTLVLPGVAAIVVGLSAGRLQRRLRPAIGVRLLTALAVLATTAVAGALTALAFGYAAQIPWMVDRVGWCRTFSRSHEAVPAWIGLASTGALLLMATSMIRNLRTRRRSLVQLTGTGPVEILSTAQPVAFAVPGRPGHIVVSEGMLDLLDRGEQKALFAHERSHLTNRHYRYTALAELAAAALPVLRVLASQVRFATERWADEDAAAEVGDRRLVARAIARAALGRHEAAAPGVMALDGEDVVARVEALLAGPSASSPVETAIAVGVGGVLVTAVSSTIQVHHLVTFAVHVCNL